MIGGGNATPAVTLAGTGFVALSPESDSKNPFPSAGFL
jgi:hypothetical protein